MTLGELRSRHTADGLRHARAVAGRRSRLPRPAVRMTPPSSWTGAWMVNIACRAASESIWPLARARSHRARSPAVDQMLPVPRFAVSSS
jgi:hypothetical protein